MRTIVRVRYNLRRFSLESMLDAEAAKSGTSLVVLISYRGDGANHFVEAARDERELRSRSSVECRTDAETRAEMNADCRRSRSRRDEKNRQSYVQ